MPTSGALYNREQPLSLAKFTDLTESNARAILEFLRWPDGPVCPHCGEINNARELKGRPDSKKPVRKGVWKCYGCREQFSVTVGTVFEDSHIPLHRWLLVSYLLCASKKGMSSHQIHRMTGISYKTVWFMTHRLRFAMSQHGMIEKLRGVVEGAKFEDKPHMIAKMPTHDLWMVFFRDTEDNLMGMMSEVATA
jgi:transposase-like protein